MGVVVSGDREPQTQAKRIDSVLEEDGGDTAAPRTRDVAEESKNEVTRSGTNAATKPTKAQASFWSRIKAMASGGLGGQA